MSNLSFPKSVQSGIPRLGGLKEGYLRHNFGEILYEVRRPIHLEDNTKYQLVTVKRSRGGICARAVKKGSEISVKSQFKLKENDFLISKRQIVHGACALVTKEYEGYIVSNEYSILKTKKIIDLRYLGYLSHTIYFQQTCFHSSIGVHVEKMIFKLKDWFKYEVDLPTIEEQQRIVAFLSSVDTKIEQLGKKKALLKQYKKGLMQKLFSQEISFKDEQGNEYPDWKECPLGNVGKTFNGLTGKTKENFGRGLPYIQYMQIFAHSKIEPKECGLVMVDDDEKQNIVKYGDAFFTTSSETPNEVGTASVLLEQVENTYLNSFCFGYRINQDYLLPEFARFAFREESFRRKVVRLAQGSTRYNMSKISLMKISVNLPLKNEQQKVANFLTAIDQKIELVASELELAKTFKKGLLQQMFI